MKRIYKYELKVMDRQEVRMPAASRILSVQSQGGKLCVWALVNPGNDEIDRVFWVCGTGNPLPYDAEFEFGEFVGTVQLPTFVWHVFVDKE